MFAPHLSENLHLEATMAPWKFVVVDPKPKSRYDAVVAYPDT